MPDHRMRFLNTPKGLSNRREFHPPDHDPKFRCLDWSQNGQNVTLEFVNEDGETCVGVFRLTAWADMPESVKKRYFPSWP